MRNLLRHFLGNCVSFGPNARSSFVKKILNFTPSKQPSFQNISQSLANTRILSIFRLNGKADKIL